MNGRGPLGNKHIEYIIDITLKNVDHVMTVLSINIIMAGMIIDVKGSAYCLIGLLRLCGVGPTGHPEYYY